MSREALHASATHYYLSCATPPHADPLYPSLPSAAIQEEHREAKLLPPLSAPGTIRGRWERPLVGLLLSLLSYLPTSAGQ